MFTFYIVSRMGTRSVSYSKRSVLAAIAKASLTATQQGMILTVEVPTLGLRRALEYELQQVDRGLAYRIEVK